MFIRSTVIGRALLMDQRKWSKLNANEHKNVLWHAVWDRHKFRCGYGGIECWNFENYWSLIAISNILRLRAGLTIPEPWAHDIWEVIEWLRAERERNFFDFILSDFSANDFSFFSDCDIEEDIKYVHDRSEPENFPIVYFQNILFITS